MSAPVVLRGNNSLRVPAEHVYFAFPTQRLAYDCVTCGARCCRGYGYMVDKNTELPGLLEEQPLLRLFLESGSGPDLRGVSNCAPGCFFLRADGLCGVQVRNGYAAKPETCRHFPFNRYVLADDYLVVTPHTWLCPIRVLSGPEYIQMSDHSALLHELQESGIGSAIARAGAPYSGTVGEAIETEMAVLATCEAQLAKPGTLVSFVDALSEAGDGVGGPHGHSKLLRLIAATVGIEPSSLDNWHDDVRNTIIGATPSIRAQILFERTGEDATVGVPRIHPRRMPSFTLALAALLQATRLMGMQETNLQTAYKLAAEYSGLVLLWSWLDTVVCLDRSSLVDLRRGPGSAKFHEAYLALVQRLVRRRQAEEPRRLGELIASLGPREPMDAADFAKFVGQRLSGCIESIESQGDQVRPRIRAWAQRMSLSVLPTGVIHQAASQAPVNAPRAAQGAARRV